MAPAYCGAVEPQKQPKLNPEKLPAKPLYGDADGPGWELSPIPFALNPLHMAEISRLGPLLWRFAMACEALYHESLKGRSPSWVADILDRGKPEALLKFAAMKRFRSRLPQVIRPDLLLTETGLMITEIDSVPGGIGFTSALNQAYRESGFPVIEAPGGMPAAFLAMLKAHLPQHASPVIAVLVSDEAADYRQEMAWLVDSLQPQYPQIHLLHPREVDLVRDRLVFTTPHGEEKPIDLLYRFFELFDLPNIPKIELIQYAVKKGWVACTPPFKPYLEEKAWLALLHHPVLSAFWQRALGETDFQWLKDRVPQGWIIDPQAVPPQAVIPNLVLRGQAVQSFQALLGLSQKERRLVLKPSGFSPLAWGSRGVTIGHDVSGEAWDERVRQALDSYSQSPFILQTYHKPVATSLSRLDVATGEVADFQGRTRLCPYFFVTPDPAGSGQDVVTLAGILATSCPADKKIIHGMKDAVMSPCQDIS